MSGQALCWVLEKSNAATHLEALSVIVTEGRKAWKPCAPGVLHVTPWAPALAAHRKSSERLHKKGYLTIFEDGTGV